MKGGFEYILGKTIDKVVTTLHNSPPKAQVFLIFSDGTYFELYGEQFTGANQIDQGGQDEVDQYLSNREDAINKIKYPQGK